MSDNTVGREGIIEVSGGAILTPLELDVFSDTKININ